MPFITWHATPIASRFPTTASFDIADGKVTFRWKDYAHKNKKRLMTVTAEEFLRRFLLHTLPRRFVRIRFFGFLANRRRGGAVAAVCAIARSSSAAAHYNPHSEGDKAIAHDNAKWILMAHRLLGVRTRTVLNNQEPSEADVDCRRALETLRYRRSLPESPDTHCGKPPHTSTSS